MWEWDDVTPLPHSFTQLFWQSEEGRPKVDGDCPLHRWHPFLSPFLSLSDHTVINFHGVDTVRQYILTLINIVRWSNVKRDKKKIFPLTAPSTEIRRLEQTWSLSSFEWSSTRAPPCPRLSRTTQPCLWRMWTNGTTESGTHCQETNDTMWPSGWLDST